MSIAGVPDDGAVSAYQAVFAAIAIGANRDAAQGLRGLNAGQLAELTVICGDVQIMAEAEQRRREDEHGKGGG